MHTAVVGLGLLAAMLDIVLGPSLLSAPPPNVFMQMHALRPSTAADGLVRSRMQLEKKLASSGISRAAKTTTSRARAFLTKATTRKGEMGGHDTIEAVVL